MYNKRQELILNFIKQTKKANREGISRFLSGLGVSASKITVLRDLDLLINDGFSSSIREKGGFKKNKTTKGFLKIVIARKGKLV